MQTIKIATSYVDKSVFRKMGDSIVSDYPVEGFKGTRTVAKLQEGRTYNFVTKVVNDGTNYKAVLVVSGNRVTREFNADGEDQTFSITLGSGEDGLYINNSENVGVVVSYNQEADFDPKPADFKTPQPFRFWCQTVLPLVYDDSLSYYELLSKVVNYLNSLINDVTNVENIYTNLTNAYTQLEAYVNTYFDNLDVSEAINEKLDYMAEHGDFDSLVQEALSRINYTAIIDAEVDEQLPSVVDTKLGAEVASQIGDVVENQIGDAVGEQIGGAVSNQIGETVANQIGDVVEDQIGDVVADQIDDAVVRPTENWLSQNFETPPVDKTLSIDNAAADAKVTGSILDYLKSIEILGVEREEVNLSSQMRKFSQSYIEEVSGIGIQNAFKISFNKPNYNCAYIRGLIGGARYKISLNAYDPSFAQIGEGWLCRNLLVGSSPVQPMYATKIDTLENRIGVGANGDYYIDIPYNCDAILFNSLNSRICDLSIVTMTFDGNILPFVTSADNGKVLSVANGEWEATEIPSGNLPPVTTGDNGKILQVSSGNWGVGEDLNEIADSVDVLENHYTITPSLNLFNPSTVEEGVFCKNINLARSAGTNFNVVTVEVEPETSYVFAEARPSALQSDTATWRYVVFCDETMTGISVIDAGVDGYNYGGFTTPANTKYAVISYRNQNVKPLVFEHAIPENWNSRYEYTSPEPTYSLKSDVVLSPSSLSTNGLNIIDENQLIDGYVQSGNYNSASGTYKCTPVIPVKPNTTYYSKTNMRYYCLYNEQKQYIHGDGGNGLKTFTTSADDRYVRITVFVADAGKYMVSDDENALYESYKKVFVEESPMLNNTQKADMENSLYLGNKLKGKKWVVCGDSFSADGGTGTTINDGIYKGKNYVYPYIIGNRTGAEIVSFAAGGRSMGYLNDPDDPNNKNSLTCPTADWYYQNIPVDADYITIYLGINDVNHNIPMGTINDNDSSTYLGAYNEVISWLIENRPFAHIGIIVTNGTGSNDMTLGQIAIAEKYGIPYINMNGDARTPVMLRSTNPNIPSSVKSIILAKQAVDPPSNTHPNDDAQLYESTFIENFLMSI